MLLFNTVILCGYVCLAFLGKAGGSTCDISSLALQEYAESSLNEHRPITNRGGVPTGDMLNSLTIGHRGPVLLQDQILIETLTHFDRERVPERVVHAKGAGAHGYFVVTHSEIQKYCKASVFSHVGKKTPIFVRFSQVIPEMGSADTVRNPRGFAIKFYTDEGNWDLVGNNGPIFFIKDAMLFPALIHSQKRNPKTHFTDYNAFWDFKSHRPETLHQVSYMFSDRGIPDGYRHMHGFGINTFKLVNKHGEQFYCKFHYLTNQGIRNLDPHAAELIAGQDPDFLTRDLFDAIATKQYPSWTFYVQIMTLKQAEQWYHNPFDATKLWPHKEFPLIKVGELTLNRNPKNYFAEVEQVAFDPANMPNGIEASPDKLLQGRLFAYFDTQRYRLGANFQRLPINRPRVRINAPTERDGGCTYDHNMDGAPNYYPNSYSKSFTVAHQVESEFKVPGAAKVGRYEPIGEDDYSQVTFFWTKVLDDGGRHRLAANIASTLADAQPFIQQRMLHQLDKVHPSYGASVRAALGHTNSTACM